MTNHIRSFSRTNLVGTILALAFLVVTGGSALGQSIRIEMPANDFNMPPGELTVSGKYDNPNGDAPSILIRAYDVDSNDNAVGDKEMQIHWMNLRLVLIRIGS